MSQMSRVGSFADGVGRPPTLHIFAQLLQARLSSSWAAGLRPALHCMRQLLHWPDIVAPSSAYRRHLCLLLRQLATCRSMLIYSIIVAAAEACPVWLRLHLT
jgi:hypothetical protein